MQPSIPRISLTPLARIPKNRISLAFVVLFALALASGIHGVLSSHAAPAAQQQPAFAVGEARALPAAYAGDAKLASLLEPGSARPLTLASEDFNRDGVDDLVAGYAAGGKGILALYSGNKEAFALGTIRGRALPLFLPKARVVELPEPPDFLATGDFNGDGDADILAGARGSNRLYFLAGDGTGNFSAPQAVVLPGALTAMVTGEIGMPDASRDVAVGIHEPNGSSLVVYKGAFGGLFGQPLVYPLHDDATSLAIGNLDGDLLADVAIVAGGDVLILHGQDWASPAFNRAAANPGAELELVSLPFAARTITIGDFIYDRDGRMEMGVLSPGGLLYIVARGELDTRPFTAAEIQAKRMAQLQARLAAGKAGVLPQAAAQWQPGRSEAWSVAQIVSVPTPLASPDVRLIPISVPSSRGPQGVVVVDPSAAQLHVMSAPAAVQSPSQSQASSSAPAAAVAAPWTTQPVDTQSAPLAALPMRVSGYARNALVTLQAGQVTPTVTLLPGDPIFTVNTTSDTVDAVPGDGTCADSGGNCSLRAAIMEANANAACATIGNCTISLPAGTFNLTITSASNAADPSSGDLDINQNMIIQGAGATSTIINGNFAVADGKDNKIFGINQDGTHNNLHVTIDGVTIQNGRNSVAGNDPSFAQTGGGVDIFLTGTTDTITLSNCIITNNTNVHSYGGGVNIDDLASGTGASVSITNCTISNNQTLANGATDTSVGGGLNLFGDNHSVTITNSTISGNSTPQVGGGINMRQNAGPIQIHNSIISGNTAGSSGGGVLVDGLGPQLVTIDQGSFIHNNTAGTTATSGGAASVGAGGGIFSSNVPTATTTLSKVIITGNSISSTAPTQKGGGGIFAGGPFSMSFSRIVGNTPGGGTGAGLNMDNSTGETGTLNATDNWWGCDTSPGAAPCNTAVVSGTGGTAVLNFTPWLVLSLGSSPGALQINQSSSLTADFLHDSNGAAVSLSNINVLLGLPISFGAVAGSISVPQATIQSNGTATATFTHDGTCNASSATATVDTNPPPTVTRPITTLCPDLIAPKTNSLGVSGVTTPLSSPTWTWTTDVLNGSAGTAPATFTNGQTIFTDTLPGSNISYSNLSFNPVTNMTCSLVGNLLTCSASGGDVTLGVGMGFFVGVTATATAAGSYVNPTGGACAVDPNNNVVEFNESNNSCSNTVIVVAPPTISKAFGAANIPLNGNTSLTFTITNPAANTVSETGVAFSDTLPSGLVVATPNGLSNNCSGTPTAVAGSGSISLTGGTVGVNTSCTVTVNVTGTTVGDKNNTSGNVASTNGGTGNTASASVTVVAPPTISKAFGAANIPLNGTTSLTFTITNPAANTVSETGVAFSDTLPSGLVVATPNGLSNNCSGTPTAVANSGSISLTGGTVAVNTSCTVAVNVMGTTGGVKNNTSGNVSSTNGGTGNTASASVTVVAPPTISKGFSATSIPVGGTSTLSFTITNPNTTVGLTGIGFTDTLPSGLQVAATPNVVGNCGGGTVTATAGSGTISLSSGALAASGSCSISADVTGTTGGTKNNTTGNVTSTEGGTGGTASATVTVVAPPTIAKAFGAANIALNGTTTVTFTITNPAANPVSETGVAFSDTLPSGLTVASTPGVVNGCGGSVTAAANTQVISLAGGTVGINTNCTITVNVTGTTAGTKNNTTGAVSSTNGGTGATSNTATVSVAAAPTISKGFSPTSIPVGGTSTLTFSITNPNTGTGLTGVAFTDTLPSGLQVAATPNASNTCNGSLSGATAGSGTISVSGGTMAASGTCTISVDLTGTAAGTKSNTTGAISSTESGPGATSNTTTLTVANPPTISKGFSPTSIPVGGISTLTFTINNPNTGTGLTGVAFTDTLPSGLKVAATPNASNTCSGTLSGATTGSGAISLSSGTIAGNGSCAISVNVTGTGTIAGDKNNTTGNVSSTNGGTGGTSNTATLTVVAPPLIAKAFGAANIPLNGTTTVTFTITNPSANTVSETGVAFSDTLPSGLTVASTPGVVNGCGGTVTAAANGGVISLVGGTVGINTNCTITVNVTGTTSGTKNNTTSTVFSANGGLNASATATVKVASPPTISKGFGASSVQFGSATTLTFTINNPNSALALTGLAVNDNLPPVLRVSSPPSASNACGGTFSATAGGTTVGLSGGSVAAGGSCSISVNVTGTSLGLNTNTTGAISSTETGAGGTSNTANITVVQAPTASTVSVNPTTQQYSDPVIFTATLSPASVLGQSPATSVTFMVGAVNMGTAPLVISGGLLTGSLTAPILQPAGSYTVTAVFGGANPNFIVGTPSTGLMVTREDATVTPSASNPMAVQVTAPGSNASVPFSLVASIVEVSDGSLGDIANATPVTCTLTPVGPGSPVTVTASTSGSGAGPLVATCNFSGLPVNVYDVVFTIGGNFYMGSGETVVTVFDPSLGFVTGGGRIINPNTGFPANFGFSVKFLKNGQTQGSLLYIEHRATGDVMLKSNAMGPLAIVGNQGIFTGKATLNSVGNYTFRATVIDNSELDTSDQFGLQVKDPSGATVADLTFSPVNLVGGNIQVPHK